jgi:hypothetical protein
VGPSGRIIKKLVAPPVFLSSPVSSPVSGGVGSNSSHSHSNERRELEEMTYGIERIGLNGVGPSSNSKSGKKAAGRDNVLVCVRSVTLNSTRYTSITGLFQ